jgi:hypothetical protein
MEWFMQALLVSWLFSILAGTDLTQKYLASPMFCYMELGKIRDDSNVHHLYCHD